jgi:hypothetical protein
LIRYRTSIWWIAAAGLVLGIGGTALAQSGSTGGAGSADVGFQRRVQLSPQEEVAQADAIIAHMDSTAGSIRRLLDAARQARDVVKSLCLSDKLSQVDVAERSAKDRSTALQAAAQRSDNELANHEFTIVAVLRQRVEQLAAEANQCVGEEVAFVGQTEVVTEVDPNLPGNGDENTSFPPVLTAPPLVTTPPPPISMTQ